MNRILDSCPVREGLVFAFFPFARSLRDWGGYENPLSIVGSPRWQRLNGVQSIVSPTAADYFTAPHSTSLAVTDFSVFCWGRLNQQVNGNLVRKIGTAGRYHVYTPNVNQVAVYDGTTVSLLTLDIDGARSLAATFGNGGKPSFYRDGVFGGLGNNNLTVPVTDGTFYFLGPLGIGTLAGCLLYNESKTVADISDLHAWSESLTSPSLPADRRYFDMGSMVPIGNAGGEVAAFDFRDVTGRSVPDRS